MAKKKKDAGDQVGTQGCVCLVWFTLARDMPFLGHNPTFEIRKTKFNMHIHKYMSVSVET